jgi:hypothetical protein
MRKFMTYMLVVSIAVSAVAQADLKEELRELDATVRAAKATERMELVPQLVELGERAFEADEFSVAVTAFDYASRLTRMSQPKDSLKYRKRMLESKSAARAYAKIAAHRGKDDAASKQKVAEFWAFVKGDWERALPVLAEGTGPVAEAAKLDQRRLGAEEAEAVADAWIVVAKKQPSVAKAIYKRAGQLYMEAANVVPTAELMKKVYQLSAKIGYDKAPPGIAIRANGKYIFSPARPDSERQTADKAFDGDLKTTFQGLGSEAWVALDLRVPRAITKIIYGPHDCKPEWQQLARTRMVGATIQVSNSPDFANAVTIHKIEDVPPAKRLTKVTVSPPGVWRYVRYVAKPGDRCVIGEFDVR